MDQTDKPTHLSDTAQDLKKLLFVNDWINRLFQDNPQSMLIYDIVSLNILNVNKAAVLKYGYSREEFLLLNIKQLRPEEDIPELLEHVYSSGYRDTTKVWRHIKKNSDLMYVTVNSNEIIYDGKKARHILINDVTDINVANEKVAKNNAWIKSILDNLNEGCQIIGTDWTYKYLNGAAIKQTRMEADQVLGKNLMTLWPGFKKTKIYKKINDCMVNKTHHSFDSEFVYPDGKSAWFNLSVQSVPEGVFVLSSDISQKKEFERSLTESEKKFRHLFKEHSAMKLLIDAETGSITDANRSAVDFYGWTHEELTRMNIGQINTLSKSELKEAINHVVNNKKHQFYFKHRTKSGNIRDVEVFSSMIISGKKKYLHSIIHDITDKKEAELRIEQMMLELMQAKTRAEESDRLKSAFLANMSHEIRTPMNGILGFMDILKEPDLDSTERNEYIDLVQLSGQRLLNTINDIIDISKIESGVVSLNEAQFNFNEILINQFNLFKIEAGTRNLELILTSLLPEGKQLVYGDRFKIESIMINLIKNALKFTHKGSVSFGAKLKDDNRIEFNVTDTGQGIPADQIHLLFNRFAQIEKSTKHSYEGSGLGLAISKGFADLMGCEIYADSKEGVGSSFFLLIPLKETKETSIVKRKSEKHDILNKSLTILVAEDDDISFKYLRTSLRKLDIEILRAYNGEEAIAKVKAHNEIGLILMDIKMPVMNGYTATEIIKTIKPDLPVIALTAFGMFDDKEKALSAGCDDYLSKPVKYSELVNMINKFRG